MTLYFSQMSNFLKLSKILLLLSFFLIPVFSYAFQVGDYAIVDIPGCASSLYGAGVTDNRFDFDPLGYNGDDVFRHELQSDNILYFYYSDTRWIIGIDSVSNNFTQQGGNPADPSGTYELDNTVDECTTETATASFFEAPPDICGFSTSSPCYTIIQDNGSMVFGISILIFLISLIMSGFLYNIFVNQKM